MSVAGSITASISLGISEFPQLTLAFYSFFVGIALFLSNVCEGASNDEANIGLSDDMDRSTKKQIKPEKRGRWEEEYLTRLDKKMKLRSEPGHQKESEVSGTGGQGDSSKVKAARAGDELAKKQPRSAGAHCSGYTGSHGGGLHPAVKCNIMFLDEGTLDKDMQNALIADHREPLTKLEIDMYGMLCNADVIVEVDRLTSTSAQFEIETGKASEQRRFQLTAKHRASSCRI